MKRRNGTGEVVSFTKEEKHKIYKAALELLISKGELSDSLCTCIGLCSDTLFFRVYYLFPEFAARKPIVKPVNDYWWPMTLAGFEKRIQVLKECIEETKP